MEPTTVVSGIDLCNLRQCRYTHCQRGSNLPKTFRRLTIAFHSRPIGTGGSYKGFLIARKRKQEITLL